MKRYSRFFLRGVKPSQADNLYTEPMLRELLADMQIVHLAEYDAHIAEGVGHHGMSALIDVVAKR